MLAEINVNNKPLLYLTIRKPETELDNFEEAQGQFCRDTK